MFVRNGNVAGSVLHSAVPVAKPKTKARKASATKATDFGRITSDALTETFKPKGEVNTDGNNDNATGLPGPLAD